MLLYNDLVICKRQILFYPLTYVRTYAPPHTHTRTLKTIRIHMLESAQYQHEELLPKYLDSIFHHHDKLRCFTFITTLMLQYFCLSYLCSCKVFSRVTCPTVPFPSQSHMIFPFSTIFLPSFLSHSNLSLSHCLKILQLLVLPFGIIFLCFPFCHLSSKLSHIGVGGVSILS